jgi:hypothetical protein
VLALVAYLLGAGALRLLRATTPAAARTDTTAR